MYCELNLFKYAHDLGKYDYYHLLSGKDFPLQSQDYIHNFFKQNEGMEFVHIVNKNSMRINKVNERVNFFIFLLIGLIKGLTTNVFHSFLKLLDIFKNQYTNYLDLIYIKNIICTLDMVANG